MSKTGSKTSLYIVLFLFILGIGFYYTYHITPVPTTPVPTTPVPTTPVPTIYPYSPLTRAFEGTWISYKYGGIEFGPVTIRATGENKFYIYGENVPTDTLRILTLDPSILMCSLPERSANNFGTALIYDDKAIKIYGINGITFKRSNETPNITISPTSTDPFEGTWISYNYAGNELGPVIISSTGGNSYYIYGNNVDSETLRVLTIDPDTLSASLPQQLNYNFGTAKIVNGKAISIGNKVVSFKRSNETPNITVSPTSTNPFEGTWRSFNYGGNEFGPVIISSTGRTSFYIYGENIPNDNLRVLTVDPTNLSCSLPEQYSNNFGTALIVEGKAILIYGNQDQSITFTR